MKSTNRAQKLRWLVPLNGGCALKKEKVEPPEMAVFSFIDLPDVLTHEIKRRTHHE